MSKSRRSRPARPVPNPLPAIPATSSAFATTAPLTDEKTAAEASLPDPTAAPVPALAFDAPAEEAAAENGTTAEAAPEPRPAPPAPPVATTQVKAESFGTTVMNYVICEGEAFAAHMRALAGARSMAELVRLQIGEFQRAADATLTCWGVLTLAASRTVSMR